MEMYRRVIFCQLFLWMFNCFANLHHVGTGLEEILNNKNDASIGDFNLLSFDYDHDDIMVYKFLETQKNSYILFICDKEGNHYIVKQEKGRELFQQFRALSETLCAHIASELNIPSHHVRLLPIN